MRTAEATIALYHPQEQHERGHTQTHSRMMIRRQYTQGGLTSTKSPIFAAFITTSVVFSNKLLHRGGGDGCRSGGGVSIREKEKHCNKWMPIFDA